MQEQYFKILVVRRPTGRHPDWVRDAWIGLEIPVGLPTGSSRERPKSNSALRDMASGFWQAVRRRADRVEGYAVNAQLAVELLEQHAPEAADWWRENAPHSVSRWQSIVFDTRACELRG